MRRPYGDLMAYRNKLQSIYNYPVYPHEYAIVQGNVGNDYKILDFGCGEGKIRSELFMSLGMNIEYVGIDPDPSLKVDFQLFKNLDEFEKAKYSMRYFNVLLMLNLPEHLGLDEFYDSVLRLNPYIDKTIIILTPNPKAPQDYMFADPEHQTFYSHEWLYGLCRHLGFQNVEIWRGGGLYANREFQFKQNPDQKHLQEMNEFQRRICLAMGFDWYGNIMIVGKRSESRSG